MKPLDKEHSAVLCLECCWLRSSWSVHDFNVCPCENQAMVDGGFDYLRYGAKDLKKVQVLKIVPFTKRKKK